MPTGLAVAFLVIAALWALCSVALALSLRHSEGHPLLRRRAPHH